MSQSVLMSYYFWYRLISILNPLLYPTYKHNHSVINISYLAQAHIQELFQSGGRTA